MRKAHSYKDVHTPYFPSSGLNCKTLLMMSLSSGDICFGKLMLANGAYLAIGLEVVPQYFPYLFQSPLSEVAIQE
jgi:hypothetical protein